MKCAHILIVTALLIFAGITVQGAPALPSSPADWVTDTAGFISIQTRQTLNTRLETYEHKSGHQILVWIGKTTGQTPIEDWTARAFQSWKVGRKGLDDGLILFLFANDRTARIEVGYGLEGQVPDAAASRIIRDMIVPHIKAGDHDGAVNLGVDQLLAKLGGTELPPAAVTPPAKPLTAFQIVIYVLLGIAFILFAIRYPALAFFILTRGRSGGNGGGGFGGGGGRSGGGGASGRW